MTLHVILDTFIGGALDFGVEFLCVDNLVDFKTAHVTSVHCDSHARLHVTGSCHDTLQRYERTDGLSSDFSHLADLLLG